MDITMGMFGCYKDLFHGFSKEREIKRDFSVIFNVIFNVIFREMIVTPKLKEKNCTFVYFVKAT